MTRPLIGFLAVLLLCLMLSVSAAAQASDETVLVATPTVDGIDIYSADSSGEVTLVRSLTGFRVGDPIDRDSWFMSRYNDLTVSLDGSQIAFTAQRSDRWSLFIYNVVAGALYETPIPTDPRPVWSPDGSALLLTGGNISPDDDFVYVVGQDSLIQLTNTVEYDERRFGWIPDSSGLFYVGLFSECETCETSQALYFVNRDGSETRLLAIGATLAPPDSDDAVCHPTWSEPNQRIYFVVGCVGEGDQLNEYLYSVDLAGNVRAELSGGLNTLRPDERGTRTVGIYPSPYTTDVYLTLSSRGGGEDRGSRSNRRIVRILAPDEVIVIYEQMNQDNFLDSSSMSPDGNTIGLLASGQGIRDGYLEVINLTTGERIIGQGTTPLDVCDVSWADETALFYAVDPTGACDVARAPQSVWVLDITSGATEDVTSELGANVWMLRRVVVTAPLD